MKCDHSRINIVGTSGSGKSTLAKKIAARLGHPYIEMDLLYWEPNWKEPSDEVFLGRLAKALERGTWVLDGNYSRSQPVKWKKVSTIVWIDYSFSRVLTQAVLRAISRGLRRQELWPGTGNRESLKTAFFSKKSIILWTVRTYDRMRKRYEAISRSPDYAHVQFIRFRSPAETEVVLETRPIALQS